MHQHYHQKDKNGRLVPTLHARPEHWFHHFQGSRAWIGQKIGISQQRHLRFLNKSSPADKLCANIYHIYICDLSSFLLSYYVSLRVLLGSCCAAQITHHYSWTKILGKNAQLATAAVSTPSFQFQNWSPVWSTWTSVQAKMDCAELTKKRWITNM